MSHLSILIFYREQIDVLGAEMDFLNFTYLASQERELRRATIGDTGCSGKARDNDVL